MTKCRNGRPATGSSTGGTFMAKPSSPGRSPVATTIALIARLLGCGGRRVDRLKPVPLDSSRASLGLVAARANDMPKEHDVTDEVSPPHTAGFLIEAVKPLRAGLAHPQRRAGNAARIEIEKAADAHRDLDS